MKKTFYSELAYVVGVLLLAVGTALMTMGDLGLSSIVAPSYILHVVISEYLPFFTFGMSGYTYEALLLIILIAIMRKFKLKYLFSFVTAVFFGVSLDLFLLIFGFIPTDLLAVRIILYVVGFLILSFGISFLFNTHVPPEVYQLFVIELGKEFNLDKNKLKIGFDVFSLFLAIALSFIFFGFGTFVGVKIGTVLTAIPNGILVGFFSKQLNKRYDFKHKWN